VGGGVGVGKPGTVGTPPVKIFFDHSSTHWACSVEPVRYSVQMVEGSVVSGGVTTGGAGMGYVGSMYGSGEPEPPDAKHWRYSVENIPCCSPTDLQS